MSMKVFPFEQEGSAGAFGGSFLPLLVNDVLIHDSGLSGNELA